MCGSTSVVRSGPFLVVGPDFPLLLVLLLLQSLQLGLIHHLLDQVFLPAHTVPQVLGKVWDQVRDQGLDGKDHVLQTVITNVRGYPPNTNGIPQNILNYISSMDTLGGETNSGTLSPTVR